MNIEKLKFIKSLFYSFFYIAFVSMVFPIYSVDWTIWNMGTGIAHSVLKLPLAPFRKSNDPGYKEIMYMSATRNHINKMINSSDCHLPLDYKRSILANFQKIVRRMVENTDDVNVLQRKMGDLIEGALHEIQRAEKNYKTLCPYKKSYEDFHACTQKVSKDLKKDWVEDRQDFFNCYKNFQNTTTKDALQLEHEACIREYEKMQEEAKIENISYKNSYHQQVDISVRASMSDKFQQEYLPSLSTGKNDFMADTDEYMGSGEKVMMPQTRSFLRKAKEKYNLDVDPDIRLTSNLNCCHKQNSHLLHEKSLFEGEVKALKNNIESWQYKNDMLESLHFYKNCIDEQLSRQSFLSTHIKDNIGFCEAMYRMKMGEEDL